MTRREPSGISDPLESNTHYGHLPYVPSASSDRLGWVGMEAARFRIAASSEFERPALALHTLILFHRAPDELDLWHEGMERHVPPPAGSIWVMPAGIPSRSRFSGRKDALRILLEPELMARVAVEAFDVDPARLTVPPIDGLDLPHLRSAMDAVEAELTTGGDGGQLAAEALANLLAVHLIRHILAPRRPGCGRDGTLPQARLRAVVEYIEGHLDANPTLSEMAAIACLSPYHFARQFKAATGLPPHQFVIMRRVERAKRLLQGGRLPLAKVAARAGFADQSQFSRHFKRIVGVSPGRFR